MSIERNDIMVWKRSAFFCLAIGGAWGGFMSAGEARQVDEAPPIASATAPEDGDAAARWRSLSADERAELRRRFAQLRGLNPEERRQLATRHRRLIELRGEVTDDLSPGERDDLARLDVAERRRRVAERVRSRLAERVRSLRQLAEEEGEPSVGELRERIRDRIAERLRRLESKGSLRQGRAQRLDRLPPDDFLDELWELRRERQLLERQRSRGPFGERGPMGERGRDRSRLRRPPPPPPPRQLHRDLRNGRDARDLRQQLHRLWGRER